jgi:hypothetical protein
MKLYAVLVLLLCPPLSACTATRAPQQARVDFEAQAR